MLTILLTSLVYDYIFQDKQIAKNMQQSERSQEKIWLKND